MICTDWRFFVKIGKLHFEVLFVQLDVNEVNLHFLGIRYTQNELVKKFGSMNNGLHQNSFISFSKNMIDFMLQKIHCFKNPFLQKFVKLFFEVSIYLFIIPSFFIFLILAPWSRAVGQLAWGGRDVFGESTFATKKSIMG